MKKIGIIILSRYTSMRLPGKALIEINGNTLIGNIIKNVKVNFPKVECIVATSNHISDDIIKKYCDNHSTKCFRGELENVAKRFLDCSIDFKLDFAIRINGDNFFLDTYLLNEMIKKIENNDYDFISNVPGRTFPYGMSIEIVKTEFYKSVYKNLKTDHDKEHVTSWIYRNKSFGNSFFFKNKKYKNLKEFKLSIDDLGDLNFIKKIVSLNNNKNNISLSKLSLMRDKLIRGK